MCGRTRILVVAWALVASLTFASVSAGSSTLAPARSWTEVGAPMPALEQLAHDRLFFIENRGQVDARVAYYVQGNEQTIFFTADGLTFLLSSPDGRAWAVKLDFLGATQVRPVGQDASPTLISYFRGPREEWKTALRTYRRLVYADLWPGIDLVYAAARDSLKYQFVLHPGADPALIRLAYRGAASVRARAGRLQVLTPLAEFQDDAPSAYQEADGKRSQVPVSYALQGFAATSGAGAAGNMHTYGFQLGPYDRGKALVIDPAVLVYCGYIGGSGDERGHAIAVDLAGSAYIVGETGSSFSFPVTPGYDTTQNGNLDAFVAKVSADGSSLDYCTFLGGAGVDVANDVAVDSGGNAYIVGQTTSNQITFPTTSGAFDTSHNGGSDAFVAKLNAFGSDLAYCGYIGGGQDDEGHAIAVDSGGAAYVAGGTSSAEDTFPLVAGPDLTVNGPRDAFVAKVASNGQSLIYCGYIGGDGITQGRAIAVDGSGAAYVAGETSSTALFPAAAPLDTSYNGGDYDAFVAKLRADGVGLLYCGYLGGSDSDSAASIAVDGAGAAYLTGQTTSIQTSFPVLGALDAQHNGGRDAFVAKVAPAGSGLAYCGYLGGSSDDGGSAIAVDGAGNAYVTGNTYSDSGSFPVTNGPSGDQGGGADAFVARVRSSGDGLDYCGYIGGDVNEEGLGIAVDGGGNAYVTGFTNSTEATFPVSAGPDLTHNGVSDVFVAKVALEGGTTPTPSPTATSSPTSTPTASATSTPTATPTATGTPPTQTPSATASPTSTPTGTGTVTPSTTTTVVPSATPTLTRTPWAMNHVVINEIGMGMPDWVEFYNPQGHAEDLTGWQLRVYDAYHALASVYTFPTLTLQAGAYVVLHEGYGLDNATDLYSGSGNTFPWGNQDSGAAGLTDEVGVGIDFVRWGTSGVAAPGGTGWGGENPTGPPVGLTLGRDAWSTDTDQGSDWSWRLETSGGQNGGALECVGLALTVEPTGSGVVGVTPGANCGAGHYLVGTQVTLTAYSALGYSFSHWSGALAGSDPVASLLLNETKSVTAHFVSAAPTATATLASRRLWLPVIMRAAMPTVSPTASPSPTQTLTPTRTATPTPTPRWSQLIVNSSFESDEAWQIPQTEYPAGYSYSRPRTGARSMRVGIPAGGNVFSYSSAQQTVELPASATEATLTFYYWPVTAWPDEDRIYFCVLRASDDVALQTTVWTEYEQAWQQRSFDLRAYAGQSIKVHFGVKNDGENWITSVYLDDVELWVRW